MAEQDGINILYAHGKRSFQAVNGRPFNGSDLSAARNGAGQPGSTAGVKR